MAAATYWQNRMMIYGPCWLCGEPRTQCWNVEVVEPDGSPSRLPDGLQVSMSTMCLSCGDGDPSYHPERPATSIPPLTEEPK